MRSSGSRSSTAFVVDLGDDVFEDMDEIVARVASETPLDDETEHPAEPTE